MRWLDYICTWLGGVAVGMWLSGCSSVCPRDYYQPAEDPSVCIGNFKLTKSKGIEI